MRWLLPRTSDCTEADSTFEKEATATCSFLIQYNCKVGIGLATPESGGTNHGEQRTEEGTEGETQVEQAEERDAEG